MTMKMVLGLRGLEQQVRW